MSRCQDPAGSRKRLFWATQPSACGEAIVCGAGCGVPGLEVVRAGAQNGCDCCPPATVDPACIGEIIDQSPVTISASDWVRGLVINMLMTDARRPDTPCGYRPGAQGGHWSESFITSGTASVGTLMRTVKEAGRVQESIAMIASYANATLQRLVERGVAVAVDVQPRYLGSGRMALDITVTGPTGEQSRLGVAGARAANGWIWQ